jgi:2-polyprenyl-3-methyl-5-hydroxy-6-metoxy-1,4-benzoquinol methylase
MKYRIRIYNSYISQLQDINKIKAQEDLEKRGPTMRNLINKYFPKDKSSKILEIGCGHGALIYFAKKMGYLNIEGIDGSAQQVKLAHILNIPEVRYGNLLNILKNMKDNHLDVIVAFDVIEHLTKDELFDLIDEIQRVLKSNGRWIVHAPNARSPFVGEIQYGDYTHEQAFTETSLKQLLRIFGFERIEFFECKPVIHGFMSFLRFVFWQMIRIFFCIINAAESGSIEYKAIWSRNLYALAYKKIL